jgi:AsmA protein
VKFPFKRFILKPLKITGISIGSLLLLLYLLPILFPGTIGNKIKSWANSSLDGEVNFSKVRLSFFDQFPSFTFSLYDFTLKGSAPFKKDTLVAADKISFGINLKTLLFDKKITIDKIFLSDALINVKVNEKGEANYNVYITDKAKQQAVTDSTSTSLKLEKIRIKNSHLVYNDASIQMLIDAKGFNYKGNGDLSEAIFDLYSNISVDSTDFYFENEPYLKNKKLNADLLTKVNTNSLAFFFERNDIRINKLPVQLKGKLDFLKNGYDLDFIATSVNSKLDDFVTAMPPQYVAWQKSTDIKGSVDLQLTLKGQYIASSNTMPELAYNMKIRDGFIEYDGAPAPLSNLFLNLETRLPSLNTDSLSIKMDSLAFNIEKDYFSAYINTTGLARPVVHARVNAAMDLEKLDKAAGFKDIDLKGKCDLHFAADGLYANDPDTATIRHKKALQSIPAFTLNATISNGYLKYTALPQAITKVNADIKASCPDNNYLHTGFSIKDISAVALNNFIKGHAAVNNLQDMMLDAGLQTNINLAEIKNIYPVDGLSVSGLLKVNVNAKGQYDAAKNKFPVTVADITLNNGSIKTFYYPNPISNITVAAKATNTDGTLKSQDFIIQPASFVFEDKPFEVQASMKNFDDIVYDVKAKGELDLAKIYKVFSQKGLDVTGYIKADMHFSGKQSDAVNKQYSRLYNEGTLQLKDVATTTEYLPKPFLVKEGLFSFQQDKMHFNNFKALYGSSDLEMSGYLQNVFAYALSPAGILKGSFTLQSNYFNVDEWMAYAGNAPKDSTKKIDSTVQSGVVIIPPNLDLDITANAKKVFFNGVHLDNAKGNMLIKDGVLQLQKTGFNLIGSETVMDVTYSSDNPTLASFCFAINAKDFDIKKAYDSVKLFHDMATAAASAQGIVSLDYKVKGKLDGNMQAIYPSLEGGGVLSVKKVKMKGFRLFNAVSSKTGKDSIANPDVSKVDIKSRIKNNIITIDRFKIKMLGFRLRMEGQTSFDGKIKLKMRLGLPPLGIIGIPMNVSGTQEDPKIKLGKGDKEELTETEYKEEGLEMPVKEEKKQ